jgi:hypothetical protein
VSLACSVCGPGFFSDSGDTSCTRCATGSYNPQPGQSTCLPCNAGSYGLTTGATSAAACLFCPVGTYQTAQGATSCTNCTAGTASNSIGAPLVNSCVACAPGTFQARAGQATCASCGANTYSLGGATACTACLAGSGAAAGASACPCSPGYASLTGLSTTAACTACAANTYASGTGSTACTPCTAGYYTVGTASISATACLACPRGTFSVGNAAPCTACPINTFAASEGSAACTDCPAGTATVAAGTNSSFGCVACAPGSYSVGTGDSCTACPVNTIGNLGTLAGSSDCVRCSAGSDTRGLTGRTTCTACPAGQTSAGTGDVCAPCPAGTISVSGGLCTPCPPNTFSVAGSETCTMCSAGSDTRGANASTTAAACLLCAPGQFSTGTGDACAACPINTYSAVGASAGATSCLACPAGTDTTGSTGNTDIGACLACPAGQISLGTLDSCFDCGQGTYADAPFGAISCVPCPVGTYSSAFGGSSQSACTPCPVGSATVTPGAAQLSECMCLPGTVGSIRDVSSTCQNCSSVCSPQALCSGGTTCGGCVAGYVGDGLTCLPSSIKLATVSTALAARSQTCPGVPYPLGGSPSCSACANLGRGTTLTGATPATCVSGGQSPCCNLPYFYLGYTGTSATQYALLEFALRNTPSDAASFCVSGMTLSLNVAAGNFSCNSPATLFHVLEAVDASGWDAQTVTYNIDAGLATLGTIVLVGTGAGGYQTGVGSLRTLTITAPADLNVINTNMRLNGGKFSFRLKRYCSTGTSAFSGAFHGISFPGTAIGNTTYFSLAPAQTHAGATCDPNASCAGGQCVCNPGFVGNGQVCTQCFGSSVCPANIACPGGNTCGTTCNPGFTYDGTACVASESRIVSVQRSNANKPGCSGTQAGLYSSDSNINCDADCQQGPSSSITRCGSSLGVPTYCCYRPTLLWTATASATTTPAPGTIGAYPLISLPVVNASTAANVCLTSASFVSTDVGVGCAVSNFAMGFLDDTAWDASTTWNTAAALTPADTLTFSATSLTAFVPSPSQLDKFSANVRLNGGRLSFAVQRWCNASNLALTNAGIDDNEFQPNNFRLINVASVQCDPQATCAGASCVCGVNYFGTGQTCDRVVCISNVAPGYNFDPTTATFAGENATTTVCAPGLTGFATRLCQWNGPNSRYGIWAEPVNFCRPVSCATQTAFNATFSSVLIGSSSGTCNVGFAGTIAAACLLRQNNSTAGFFDTPIGSCTLITCTASTYAFANWPLYAPMGAATLVNGTCVPGFRPTNPALPPRRLCSAAGTYLTTLDNPCTQIFCDAQSGFDNADWTQTAAGSTAVGTCAPGYVPGSPLRLCQLDGTFATTVTNPCQPIRCPALRSYEGASYDAANAGVTATGVCLPGYQANGPAPTLACSLSGEWASTTTDPCQQIVCPAIADDGSTAWPSAVAANPPTLVTGSCLSGFYVMAGAPYRGCDINGTATPVQNPCQAITCPALTSADASNATFAESPVAATVTGTCLPGYAGTATRACTGTDSQPGTWGPPLSSCTPVYCAAVDLSNDPTVQALFPGALADTAVVGACAPGLFGRPRLTCGLDGQYDLASLENPCNDTIPCPALLGDVNADWAEGTAGVMTGTCRPGYFVATAPFVTQRTCSLTTGWGVVAPSCQQISCPATTANGASFASVAAGTESLVGVCAPGFAGSATANCSILGAWSFEGECTAITCPATGDDTVSYASAAAGASVLGVCAPGYGGNPQRVCTLTGVWLAPTGVACARGTCSPLDDGTAVFGQADSDTPAVAGTCEPGYTATGGNPPTRDCRSDLSWGPTVNACTQLSCAGTTDATAHATFATVFAGQAATGTCIPGYTPSATPPSRTCLISGAWSDTTGGCDELICPSGNIEYNAVWPSGVSAGTLVSGAYCAPGWSGSIARQCQLDGQWAPSATGGCVQVFCQPTSSGEVDGNAAWPLTAARSTPFNLTVATCAESYRGSPTRLCNSDGTWGPVVAPCQLNACGALAQEGNAAWPTANAGSTVQGACLVNTGFEGIAVRACLSSGVWGPITTACVPTQPPCASSIGYQSRTNWPSARAGDIATGTCALGYTFSADGPPTRACIGNGVGQWSPNVTNDCVLSTGGSGQSRISEVTVADADVNSILLTWTASESATRFRVLYTSDLVTFSVAPPPAGYGYINTTALRVDGLAEATTYYFRVYAGDDEGFDTDFFTPLPVGRSLIAAARFNVQTTVTSTTSIRFSFQPGSALTQRYEVDGQRVSSSRRELPTDVWEPLQNGTATFGTPVVVSATGLTAGTVYAFRVRTFASDGSSNTATYSFQTQAVSGFAGVPEGSVAINGAVLGGVAGAIAVLILGLIAGFAVSRRMTNLKQKKMLAEYSEQLQMLTLGRGSGNVTFLGNLEDMDAKQLKANLTVPRTQMIGEGAAQVADTASVQLPAFLLIDYTTDVRPEARLSSSGAAGAVFRAQLLAADAIQRNGGPVVAMKEMVEWPSLSDEDNAARFKQELAMMWALSFHPNVAKLIAYTEQPPTVLTKLYPTDLFRYLHMQDDKEQLQSHLLLHLASGLAAGVAAIHSLKIAHRDLSSPNVLLAEPKAGAAFPDPVIADFGIARATEDNTRFESVNGYSPRYAAPEVIARVQIKTASTTLEEDQLSDLYSLGVVLWEMLSRRIPWDGFTTEEIERHVRNGERVSELEVDGHDKIVELVNDVIVSLLQSAGERRPSALATNRKFARFIRALIETDDDDLP